VGGKRRVRSPGSEKANFCNLKTWEHKGEIVCVVVEKQGGRERSQVRGFRYIAGDKKRKKQQTGNRERKERLRVDGCLERAEPMP
jgi:hypothetical protein